MLSNVAKNLSQVLVVTSQSTTRKPRLLFSGHSAGGAVAQIFYAHLMKYQGESDDLLMLKQGT
jgi:hypothetical protein